FDTVCDGRAPPTISQLDVLGRPLTITLPDATARHMAYAIGPDRQGQLRFTTTTTDALGARTVGYEDIAGRLLAIQQLNAPSNETIGTEYAYDAVDQLRTVRDDHGSLTTMTYALAGRSRFIDSPDAGKTETVYDAAGNLTQKVTATLRASSQAITYDY